MDIDFQGHASKVEVDKGMTFSVEILMNTLKGFKPNLVHSFQSKTLKPIDFQGHGSS